jgi:hypothetical protein
MTQAQFHWDNQMIFRSCSPMIPPTLVRTRSPRDQTIHRGPPTHHPCPMTALLPPAGTIATLLRTMTSSLSRITPQLIQDGLTPNGEHFSAALSSRLTPTVDHPPSPLHREAPQYPYHRHSAPHQMTRAATLSPPKHKIIFASGPSTPMAFRVVMVMRNCILCARAYNPDLSMPPYCRSQTWTL